MCLTSVRHLSDKPADTMEVYRAARRYVTKNGVEYGPLYVNKSMRWKIGKWYTANGDRCHRFLTKTVGMIHKARALWDRRIKDPKPMIQASSGSYYEAGFHSFKTFEDARSYFSSYSYGSHAVLKIQIKGIVCRGRQGDRGCFVSKKQKILQCVEVM